MEWHRRRRADSRSPSLTRARTTAPVAPNTYRPYTTAGVYVPTASPALPHWGKRRPWVMTSGDQFRPGPPPSLTSEVWKRDLDEIKAMGALNNSKRTPEQTAIALVWEATGSGRSTGRLHGRWRPCPDVTSPTTRACWSKAAMAMDDALIAVFDAKYTYNFWRPCHGHPQ